MIFAELMYAGDYGSVHDELVSHLRKAFKSIESGHQGDSWIWVLDGGEKVAIDTFSSMRHQVKSARPGPHVQAVIEALRQMYTLHLYETPVLEGDED